MEHSLAWKTLAKRTIFKDKWVNLEASDCELPDGRVIAPFMCIVPVTLQW